MSERGPRITVGIPVYNREVLVRKAIDSVLSEPLDDLELLVVDDGSTDGTWEVLNSYDDPRLQLVRNPENLGLFGNFNRCIQLARAPYVLTLCDDDALEPGFIAEAADILDRNRQAGLVSSRGRGRVEDTGEIKTLGGSVPSGLYKSEDAIIAALWSLCTYYHNPFNAPSGILLRAELARQAGCMDESMAFGADVKLYLRMLETSDLIVLERFGCEAFLHKGQMSAKNFEDARSFIEFVDHFENHRELLARKGWLDYARAHLAGYLMGSSINLRRLGFTKVAQHCMALLRERHFPISSGLLAGVDSMRKRSQFMRSGRPSTPVPFQPTPMSTASAA